MEHTYKGAAKHIGVVLEDRAGGRKHITRITAMEAFAIDPGELATALQRRFQANARCASACEAGVRLWPSSLSAILLSFSDCNPKQSCSHIGNRRSRTSVQTLVTMKRNCRAVLHTLKTAI